LLVFPEGELLNWDGKRAAITVVVPPDDRHPSPTLQDAGTLELLPGPTYFLLMPPSSVHGLANPVSGDLIRDRRFPSIKLSALIAFCTKLNFSL
jgi:hypothetical protein